jgi:hypothetical protein
MSQENVELIRAAIEDFIAGDSEFDAEGVLTKIAGEEIGGRGRKGSSATALCRRRRGP